MKHPYSRLALALGALLCVLPCQAASRAVRKHPARHPAPKQPHAAQHRAALPKPPHRYTADELDTRARLYNRLLWTAEALSKKAEAPFERADVNSIAGNGGGFGSSVVTPERLNAANNIAQKRDAQQYEKGQAVADERNGLLLQAWHLLEEVKDDPLFQRRYTFSDRRVYLGRNTNWIAGTDLDTLRFMMYR